MPDSVACTQVLVPKAGKADIWRLAVIWQYGGVYVDSDVKASLKHRRMPLHKSPRDGHAS